MKSTNVLCRKIIAYTHIILGGLDSKESAYNARDLGWEDPPEKGMTTHLVSLLENHMDRGAWRLTVHGISKSLDMTE